MAARIRMNGVADDALIPTPPAGKATLFYNNDLRVYRAKLDDGSVITVSSDPEFIQDTVGALFQDSSTIDFTYDDAGNVAFVEVIQSALDPALIPNTPFGNLSAANLQDALNELQGDIDNINLNAIELAQDAIASAISSGTQDGIDVVYDDSGNSLSFVNIDKGSTAVTNHEATIDPHPQYETSAEAQAKVDAHANLTNNPHAVTATQVGLGNVDNTSDANKPVSTAQQAALDLKYDASNPNNYIDAAGAPVQPSDIADFETTTELNARDTANRDRANHTGTQLASTISDFNASASAAAPVQSVAGKTGTVSLVKADVGLDNVDNTSDANKPVSTAQQAALDLKYDASNPNGYETLAQLNARDTSNRDRANHTGTQLASTISDFNTVSSAAAPVQSVAGKTGTVSLVKADVGLSNVDNTSDLDKPISTATQSAIDLKENLFNPNNESVFFDDFLTGINTNLGWSLTQSGAGAGSQIGSYGVAVTQKAVGVLQLDTGTTATGRAAVHRAVNGFVLGYAEVDLTWRFALPTPSTPTQRYVIYAGLIDNVGAGAPVDGVYFVYSDVLGPNWLCITRSNNTQTTTTTTVAPDNVHNRYRIIVNTSGTEANFYINDVLVATSTTNIPNTSARLTGIGAKIEKLIGTTQSEFEIDYYYHKITIPGGRS